MGYKYKGVLLRMGERGLWKFRLDGQSYSGISKGVNAERLIDGILEGMRERERQRRASVRLAKRLVKALSARDRELEVQFNLSEYVFTGTSKELKTISIDSMKIKGGKIILTGVKT